LDRAAPTPALTSEPGDIMVLYGITYGYTVRVCWGS